MKAMILAAGLGSRLQPLTLNRPKALLEVQGVPLLALVLARLTQHGFTDIVVNAYHLADQIVAFLDDYQKQSGHARLTLAVSRETRLLDTGGGVQNAAWFFDDGQPFLVHNVDVLTDLDLNRLMEAHRTSKALATLAVRERKTTRYFLFDKEDRLCGWQSLESNETRMARTVNGMPTPLGFMGIQVLSPEIFNKLTAASPFSLVEAYLQLAAAGESISAFRADAARWMDLGRKEQLELAPALFGQAFFETLKKNDVT
jgi:NDP-sugar pyrophosphorylase family protein